MSIGLIFALLTIANAGCNNHLTAARFFSVYSIAKAIDELGPQHSQIFVDVIHGLYYESVAKKYNMTVAEVKEIAFRGIDILFRYRKQGL